MRLLWGYIKKYKSFLWLALVLATINQVFSLLDPQIFRLIVDRYASHASDYTTHAFLVGVALLLLLSVGVVFVSRVAKNFQDYYVNVITQRVGTDLYAESVSHAFSLPYSVFEDQRSGELLQKLQKARADSQQLITSFINSIFLALVGIIFVVVYAFIVHPYVGITYLSLIPIIGISTFIITRRIRSIQKTIIAQTAGLAGSTTETLRNVELVKSLGLEAQEIGHLNNVNTEILKLELKKIKLVRVLSFIQGTLLNAMRSLLLLLLLWLIARGDVTLGQFFSLFVYSFFIFTPLSDLGNIASQYQETRASLEQLAAVWRLPPEPVPANPETIGELKEASFKNVSFTYQSADKPSVDKINLNIKAGETVAFVGPSGSGKSTLVKLLVGLYQPTVGELLFNNINAKNIDFVSLRRRVGLVAQETQLFAGTLRENLLFVKPEATDDECKKVLTRAAADNLLERSNQGLYTKIGEGGIKVSGGERQRLAIARALLRDPELLIFDEATSSLDSITEKSITETIRTVTTKRQRGMTILIAHRLSTIIHADRIYVLEKGKIIEIGTHEELLKTGGLYSALWRQQIAEGETGYEKNYQFSGAGV